MSKIYDEMNIDYDEKCNHHDGLYGTHDESVGRCWNYQITLGIGWLADFG